MLIPSLVGCCVVASPSRLRVAVIVALLSARWTAICFPVSLLSLSENLHARIASGTVDLGQRNGPWGATIFWLDNLPAKKPWQSPAAAALTAASAVAAPPPPSRCHCRRRVAAAAALPC
jgi:hypothetical protein